MIITFLDSLGLTEEIASYAMIQKKCRGRNTSSFLFVKIHSATEVSSSEASHLIECIDSSKEFEIEGTFKNETLQLHFLFFFMSMSTTLACMKGVKGIMHEDYSD